jgi:hypothetical protein
MDGSTLMGSGPRPRGGIDRGLACEKNAASGARPGMHFPVDPQAPSLAFPMPRTALAYLLIFPLALSLGIRATSARESMSGRLAAASAEPGLAALDHGPAADPRDRSATMSADRSEESDPDESILAASSPVGPHPPPSPGEAASHRDRRAPSTRRAILRLLC